MSEGADLSSETKALDTEAAAVVAEKSEESDSTEDSLAVYSADHNLPDVASSTATVHRIEATNSAP
jgi:glycerate-2-kinase